MVDATPVALLVAWSTAKQLPDDSWVQVHGPVHSDTYNGQPLLLIQAQSVGIVTAPAQPYLYP